MVMFGAMYYIVPRLVGWEWPSANLIRWHFWLAVVGGLLMVAALTFGGMIQGFALHDPQVNFMSILDLVWPWRLARSVGGVLMFAAHIVFAVLFVMMLLKIGKRQAEPTLFADPQPEKETAEA